MKSVYLDPDISSISGYALHFCNSRTIDVIPPSFPKIVFFNWMFAHAVYCTQGNTKLSLRCILVFIYYHYSWENYCLVTDFSH